MKRIQRKLNSLKVLLKELCKYIIILYLFTISDLLSGEGLNVSIKSGEIIIAHEELLGFNYLKNNEGTDEIAFETKDNTNFLLSLSVSPDTIYFLNSLILECTSKKFKNFAFEINGDFLDVQSFKELYTALDSKGNMVGDNLKESDLKFWGQKKSFFNKETSKWVNIDFEKDNTEGMEYILIEYSGDDSFKLPLRVQEKSFQNKEEEKNKNDFNLEDLFLKIYQWNGNSWEKLSGFSPVSKCNCKKAAIKFYKQMPLKFRLTLMTGTFKLNSVHLVKALKVTPKNINIDNLPFSLKTNDSEYLKITADEKFNTTLNLGKNNFCVLKAIGYFEVGKDKNNIPKGIDDILNRFLSRIKFW